MRKEHKREEPWTPELVVALEDGTSQTLDMTKKHSSLILAELLKISGTGSGKSEAAGVEAAS